MRCEAIRWDHHYSSQCRRDATKEYNGKHLCGHHYAGAVRSANSYKNWEEERESVRLSDQQIEEVCRQLSTSGEMEVAPFRAGRMKGYSTTHVVVSIKDLERLLGVHSNDG